jgi:hypothetical protein
VDNKNYGKIGYEAYAVETGGKTYDGRNMPKWDELPDKIKIAWQMAADRIVRAWDHVDPGLFAD